MALNQPEYEPSDLMDVQKQYASRMHRDYEGEGVEVQTTGMVFDNDGKAYVKYCNVRRPLITYIMPPDDFFAAFQPVR